MKQDCSKPKAFGKIVHFIIKYRINQTIQTTYSKDIPNVNTGVHTKEKMAGGGVTCVCVLSQNGNIFQILVGLTLFIPYGFCNQVLDISQKLGVSPPPLMRAPVWTCFVICILKQKVTTDHKGLFFRNINPSSIIFSSNHKTTSYIAVLHLTYTR